VERTPLPFLSPSRALGLSLSHEWVLPFTSPPVPPSPPALRLTDASLRLYPAFSFSVGQHRSKLAFLSSPLSPGYLNPQARKAFGDSQRQPLGSRPRFASPRLVRSLAVCTREETRRRKRRVSRSLKERASPSRPRRGSP
jgi:hypothetical protein